MCDQAFLDVGEGSTAREPHRLDEFFVEEIQDIAHPFSTLVDASKRKNQVFPCMSFINVAQARQTPNLEMEQQNSPKPRKWRQ